MAKQANQKLKMICLMRILEQETDEDHSLTLAQIIEALNGYGINVERKSLYSDLELLRTSGMDIVASKEGYTTVYRLASRQFEQPEIRLLVDAVQSSKFITKRKTEELIHKMETLVSKYGARNLSRQVFVSNRIKSMNESIYYNVDRIQEALLDNRMISFRYSEWTITKELSFRRNGELYWISPWALTWDDENYYMIGYDGDADKVKHYRVDKMSSINVLELPRSGAERFADFDLAGFGRRTFGMFGGEDEFVTLRFENRLIGVAIDRFGRDIPIIRKDEGHFETKVHVTVSGPFYGWIFGLGEGVEILGPQKVKEDYVAMAGAVIARENC